MNRRRKLCLERSASRLMTCGVAFVTAVAHAGFVGLSCEEYFAAEWMANGYDTAGLTTYRVYAHFDVPTDGVLFVFGGPGLPMSVNSTDGMFHNDASFGSNTAPIDLTGSGLWSNQWDTYVTIAATEAADDATSTTPDFSSRTNDLAGSWSDSNLGWFVTPDATQGTGTQVLLCQLVVAEGQSINGTLNLFLRDLSEIDASPIPPCVSGLRRGCCLPDEGCSRYTQLECETMGGQFLAADIAGGGPAGDEPDCDTGFVDLISVLSRWGACPAQPAVCPADLDRDGVVGLSDLLMVLAGWGHC